MDLLRELQDLADRYQRGVITLRDLEDALADLAIPISGAGDPEASALSALMWRLISEHSYGHRAEAAIRRALHDAMPVRYTHAQVALVRTTATHYVRYNAIRSGDHQSVTLVNVGAIA